MTETRPRRSTQWDEAALSALSSDEHDFQEFKGSAWTTDGVDLVPSFLPALSKQISAFANGAGGRLFIGLDDNGRIDGGVPTALKRGGVRSWLEDVIPGLVDPVLPSFNVYEIQPDTVGSRIRPGCAVYVVEVHASDLAPHQAADYRYYLRIAGKSRPMGNVHIQDVLHRTHHPVVRVQRVAPYGAVERVTDDARGPKALLSLRVFLVNEGRTLASHVGAEVVLPRALVSRDARARTAGEATVAVTQSPGAVAFFRYQPHPLFPAQHIFFLRVWLAVHSGNVDQIRNGGATVRCRVFADDAPPWEVETVLADLAAVRSAVRWVTLRSGGA